MGTIKRKVKSFLKFGDANYNDNRKKEFIDSLIGLINHLQGKLFTKKISDNEFKIHKYILNTMTNTITFPSGDSLDLEETDTQALIDNVSNYAILEEDGGGAGAPAGGGGGGGGCGGEWVRRGSTHGWCCFDCVTAAGLSGCMI